MAWRLSSLLESVDKRKASIKYRRSNSERAFVSLFDTFKSNKYFSSYMNFTIALINYMNSAG